MSTIKRWRSSRLKADLSGLVQLPCFTAKEYNYSVSFFFAHRWCLFFVYHHQRQVQVSAFKIGSMQRASGQSRPVATEPHLAQFWIFSVNHIDSVLLGQIFSPLWRYFHALRQLRGHYIFVTSSSFQFKFSQLINRLLFKPKLMASFSDCFHGLMNSPASWALLLLIESTQAL